MLPLFMTFPNSTELETYEIAGIRYPRRIRLVRKVAN